MGKSPPVLGSYFPGAIQFIHRHEYLENFLGPQGVGLSNIDRPHHGQQIIMRDGFQI